MRKDIRSSSSLKALAASIAMPPLADAMDAVRLSVDRFCLLAGVEALAEMMEEGATAVCGARHRRHADRRGWRWGTATSEIGYHGGKVKVTRPRVRDRAGKEVSLESWQVLRDGDLLLEWALNLMVLNVSTRKLCLRKTSSAAETVAFRTGTGYRVPPIYSIRPRNFGISAHRRISSPAWIRSSKSSSPSSARPF